MDEGGEGTMKGVAASQEGMGCNRGYFKKDRRGRLDPMGGKNVCDFFRTVSKKEPEGFPPTNGGQNVSVNFFAHTRWNQPLRFIPPTPALCQKTVI